MTVESEGRPEVWSESRTIGRSTAERCRNACRGLHSDAIAGPHGDAPRPEDAAVTGPADRDIRRRDDVAGRGGGPLPAGPAPTRR